MNIFSRTATNFGRQGEVDLLRGFTAIDLIICHVGLYLGSIDNKGLWTFCDIFGSEFAAPVFMVLMGISMVYSRHQQPKEMFKRGIRLFVLGYAINLFRSILPLLILGPVDEWASVEAFFIVDILPFAGLSFMLIALLKKLKLPNIAVLIISMVMVVIDQFIMLPDTITWNSEVLTGIVNLFCPVTQWSCFPFLTWFFFPAFGLVCGELLTHCSDKKKLYCILMPIGLLGVGYVYYQFHCLYPDYTSYYWGNNFYYMGLKNVLLTALFVLFALSFWFFSGKALPNIIKTFLNFLSKNLNTFYIISWIIISVLMHNQAICGWKLNAVETVGMFVLVTAVCALTTKIWLSAKTKIRAK